MDELNHAGPVRRSGLTATQATTVNLVILLTACLGFACNTVSAANQNDIVVVESAGTVKLTRNGNEVSLPKSKIIEAPLTIETGGDGSIELMQGKTRVALASDSKISIPANRSDERRIERVVQDKGSAYYDVEERQENKLRVETPFLVSVIKGTKFNVSVDESSTTVALFEGSLEVLSDQETIDLLPGEVATGSSGGEPYFGAKFAPDSSATTPTQPAGQFSQRCATSG